MGIRFTQPNKHIKGSKNPNWKGGKIRHKCKCGKFFFIFPCKIKNNRGKYCSKKCVYKFVSPINAIKMGKMNIGRKPTRSFVGVWISKEHYRMIYQPYHPFAQKRGYVAEHRLIMEKYLRRFLKPEEVIHHKNHNRQDNRIENLELCKNQSEHSHIHLG